MRIPSIFNWVGPNFSQCSPFEKSILNDLSLFTNLRSPLLAQPWAALPGCTISTPLPFVFVLESHKRVNFFFPYWSYKKVSTSVTFQLNSFQGMFTPDFSFPHLFLLKVYALLQSDNANARIPHIGYNSDLSHPYKDGCCSIKKQFSVNCGRSPLGLHTFSHLKANSLQITALLAIMYS